MAIRSIRDLAAVVRGRRTDLGMNQVQLAELAGVSWKWIYEFEASKATAEPGLLLRVEDAFGLDLELTLRSGAGPSGHGDTVDLDALLDEHRGQ